MSGVCTGVADGCESPCVCWDSDQILNELVVRAGLIEICQVAGEPHTCLKPMARAACRSSDPGVDSRREDELGGNALPVLPPLQIRLTV